MVNEDTVDCHPSPSELNLSIHPPIFSQTCVSHHGCEKFQICGVKTTGKYICESES